MADLSPIKPSTTGRVIHLVVLDHALCHFRPKYGWTAPVGEPEKCLMCERLR